MCTFIIVYLCVCIYNFMHILRLVLYERFSGCVSMYVCIILCIYWLVLYARFSGYVCIIVCIYWDLFFLHGFQVILALQKSCAELNEEDLSKVAVNLLNCQSAVEDRTVFPCTSDMVRWCSLAVTFLDCFVTKYYKILHLHFLFLEIKLCNYLLKTHSLAVTFFISFIT